jgi:hypothetical protein
VPEITSQYLLLTIETLRGRQVARTFSPPNGARRDWEFGNESYTEALTTALNTLARSGWKLTAIDHGTDGRIYILTMDATPA